jgi:hypothetical protein
MQRSFNSPEPRSIVFENEVKDWIRNLLLIKKYLISLADIYTSCFTLQEIRSQNIATFILSRWFTTDSFFVFGSNFKGALANSCASLYLGVISCSFILRSIEFEERNFSHDMDSLIEYLSALEIWWPYITIILYVNPFKKFKSWLKSLSPVIIMIEAGGYLIEKYPGFHYEFGDI